MRAYIAIPKSRTTSLQKEMAVLTEALLEFDVKVQIFADQYSFAAGQEKEMMQQAMADIDRCDLLIAEVSEKAIGVGLEAGYAKGKGKTIIYLRRSDAEHSTTVAGISDYQIVYHGLDDLKAGLQKIIKLWLSNSANSRSTFQNGK